MGAEGLPGPRRPERPLRPPSPAELARLFAMAKETDADLADFILLAAAIGARRSELVVLRWSDVASTPAGSP